MSTYGPSSAGPSLVFRGLEDSASQKCEVHSRGHEGSLGFIGLRGLGFRANVCGILIQ